MSWWDDDKDILGDEPADRIKGAWRTLIARRRARGATAPTLGEALEAFVDAMREQAFGFRSRSQDVPL